MLIKVNRLIDSSNTTYGVFLFLLVAIFLTFSKALSCYFTADDFWHLPLLYKTFNQTPIYLFENFWGPWANKSNLYLFYRPLTELSLALDYMIYRGNPFGYHLSNLIYHWINACLVFVLSKEAIGTERFDIRLHYMEDLDFWFRLSRFLNILSIPEYTNEYIFHDKKSIKFKTTINRNCLFNNF